MQIIFHIDLNAFFASAEIVTNPSLKGKPIVICRESRRSIITTASYEARKYGIHSAMPLFQAKKLCPDIITVAPHFKLYKTLSKKFFEHIAQYSPILEVASIDECYVDMTEYIQKHQIQPYLVAKAIQKSIHDSLGLDCSIGIAPNKFLAKMASDMKKPKGITIITKRNYRKMIWHLDISEMYGIGKKTQPKLRNIGIQTIGDLAKYENYIKTKPIFGKNAFIYYQRANGRDYSKINYAHNELKSIGNSITFEQDSNDEAYIRSIFHNLSREVSNRAINRNLVSNSISITLKYSRDISKTKQMLIDEYTNDSSIIYATALLLFEKIYHGEMLRLVGVSLNNVIHQENLNEQLNIFNYQNITHSSTSVDHLLNDLNSHIKNGKLMKASNLIHDNVQKKYLENNE